MKKEIIFTKRAHTIDKAMKWEFIALGCMHALDELIGN